MIRATLCVVDTQKRTERICGYMKSGADFLGIPYTHL